ncbi:MAG: amidase [Egibacteraceae bacterium]
MGTRELWQRSATELADLIRTEQVTSVEVIEAHLARIAAVNPTVNAVTVVLADQALAAAADADQALAAGQPVGPLHGVPITVKENIDLAGSATTQGVVALAEQVPARDAPHIAQLKAAGAIPIGRTNLPDFGMRWHTDNALYGATHNPWDATRSPGGSSGGEAAALATGMTPLGMGNDLGGSLRLPAQACGITALRPTLGRVPWATSVGRPDLPITIQMFGVQGPMARHVSDLRLALEAMSGADPRDPWWTPAPLHGPPPQRPVRVAVILDPSGQGVDRAVSDGVERAAEALADAGYEVREVDPPPVAKGANLWGQLFATELRMAILPVMQRVASTGALAFLDAFFSVVPPVGHTAYVMDLAARNGIARAWAQFQHDWPLVLGPVATIEPPPVGFDLGGPENVSTLVQAHRLMLLVNLLGLPAVAVPVGFWHHLPQGVQIIGPRYREDLCLDAAQALEDRHGVITPIDPVSSPDLAVVRTYTADVRVPLAKAPLRLAKR